MQVYQKEVIVKAHDLDQLNHVNNVRYVQWIQDIAEAHWLRGASKEILDTCYWVLIKHTINYKGQAFLGDTISIKTYVSKSEGVTSTRHVKMLNISTNTTIIESETTWCLMDTKTNRPKRITPEIKALFN